MAEQESEGLVLPQQEAGGAFKAEMWLANTFLGYWKQLAALIGVGLVAVLVYGMWHNKYIAGQRATTGAIADVRFDIPTDIRPGDITDDQKAKLSEAAGRMDEIGAEARGTARTEAYLNAAELYRIMGDRESQRASLTNAADTAHGALRYATEGALANLDLEEDKGEQALERWRKMTDEMDGILAQRSAMDLALALEHLNRNNEAAMVYSDFLTRWPDHADKDDIQSRLDRVSGGTAGTDEPAEDAPTEELSPEDEEPSVLAPDEDPS